MIPNTATYAIGDVHGRADLLNGLLSAIDKDATNNRWTPRIIFLGDIIDHGPHSRSAMDVVCRTLRNSPDSKLVLGNHDNYLMEFMTANTIDPDRFKRWLSRIGGYATFLSYGLDGFSSLEDMAAYFREMYDEHLKILQNASKMIIDRKFAFVHAGIDPEVSLQEQSNRDLMWIRDKFLDFDRPLPHVFVHGHTTSENPVVKANRIGIDTGAYKYGRLTCLAISPDQSELEFITAEITNGRISIEKLASTYI